MFFIFEKKDKMNESQIYDITKLLNKTAKDNKNGIKELFIDLMREDKLPDFKIQETVRSIQENIDKYKEADPNYAFNIWKIPFILYFCRSRKKDLLINTSKGVVCSDCLDKEFLEGKKKRKYPKCSGCLKQHYCCQKAQFAHWPMHKPLCHIE